MTTSSVLSRAMDESAKAYDQLHPHPGDPVPWPSVVGCWTAWAESLPGALADGASRVSCGAVDGALIASGARGLLAAQLADYDAETGWIGLILHLPLDDASYQTIKAQAIDTILNGYTDTHGTFHPGVLALAGEAYNQAVAQLEQRIGKWGVASILPDPDENISALGFKTLVRTMEPEATVFNLFPASGLFAATAMSPVAGANDLAPTTAAVTSQYRPFENRGLEGRLLIEFPSLVPAPGTLTAGLPATGTASVLGAPALQDLVLDITFEGCYHPDLASAARASRVQQAEALGLASSIASRTANPIMMPGILPTLSVGAGEVQTFHFSLRAHRNRTLQTWIAAVQDLQAAGQPTGTLNLPIDPSTVAPLGRDDPFTPLSNLPQFSVQLVPAVAPTLTTLAQLESTLQITLSDLGVANATIDVSHRPEAAGRGSRHRCDPNQGQRSELRVQRPRRQPDHHRSLPRSDAGIDRSGARSLPATTQSRRRSAGAGNARSATAESTGVGSGSDESGRSRRRPG